MSFLPAHVAVHKKGNTWLRSNFLKICEKEFKYSPTWFVPKLWSTHQQIQDDICWTIIKNSNSKIDFADMNKIIDFPFDVDFYFNQPVDLYGNLTPNASFGKTQGSIYKSPNSVLHETVGFGFKGASGSLVTKRTSDEFVGMFVRRGVDLGSKPIDPTNNSYDFTQNLSTMPRGIVMTKSVIFSHVHSGGINIDKFCQN